MLDVSLHHRWVTGLVAVVVLGSLPFLYNAAQRELPIEDQSTVLTAVKSPQQPTSTTWRSSARSGTTSWRRCPSSGRWLINGSDGVSTASAASTWCNGTSATARPTPSRPTCSRWSTRSRENIFAFSAAAAGLDRRLVQMVVMSAADYPVVYEAMEGLKKAAPACSWWTAT